MPSRPHHFELLGVTLPRNLEEDVLLGAKVFVGHGLLVFDTLGDFAYDDRSPTLAGSDFPRSRKVIATECSVDAPERFARGIYGQRNPTILLQAQHPRRALQRRSSYPWSPHSRQPTLPITLSEGWSPTRFSSKWRVRQTSPRRGARGGRTGKFRAIAPRLECTSRNRPGLQHDRPTACSVD